MNQQETIESDRRVQRAGLTAGVGLLAMTCLSIYGIVMTIDKLWIRGDAATTAENIVASEGAFRIGVLCFALVAVLDVVVAWALKVVFDPVSPIVSGLAASIRVAYAAVMLVAVGHLVTATQLLTERPVVAGLATSERQAQALLQMSSFDAVWHAGLLLFGAHLLLVGYLAIRSGSVPTWLGVLLLPAGAGYVADTIGLIVVRDYALNIGAVTFVGEAVFMIWLLARSRRMRAAPPVT